MIDTLIRPHFKSFQPYRSARSEARHASVFLDANELPASPALTLNGDVALNRYPDPFQIDLRTKLAGRFGVTAEHIFAGSGSDEIIDLLIRLFCEPEKDNIVILEPTYGVYRVYAEIHNVPVISVELDERFQIDLVKTISNIDHRIKLLFCCSPNNPTGNLLSRQDIFALCEKFSGIVIVDQAYSEFASQPDAELAREVTKHENLVILKTLSKAWGLAGIRIGYCIAHPLIITYLLRIKAPYNINAVSSSLALEVLADDSPMRTFVNIIMSERSRLVNEFSGISSIQHTYPSDANFILVESSNRDLVYNFLSTKGILVRRRSEPRLKNCLRITIGSEKENSLLLSFLKELK